MEILSKTRRGGRQYAKLSANLTQLMRLQSQGYPGSEAEEENFRLLVPARYKRRVREQLNRVGINESSLFPEPEHQMRYIAESYKKGYRGLNFGWEKKFEE